MFDPRERSQPITSYAFLIVACLSLCSVASAAPSITLSKKSGPPTSRIFVSGRGFRPNVGVDIYFGTKDQALVVTDSSGKFDDAKIHAPREARPGEHWVTALERNDDKGAQEPFVVETDWAKARFDPDNSGFNFYENALNSKSVIDLGPKWVDALPNDGVPVVANGVIYFANSLGYVYALNARTGHVLWQYKDRCGSVFSTPSVVNGIVYFGGYCDVHALDAKTGKVVWDEGQNGVFALTITNGVIYFTTAAGYALALDAKNGSELWSYYLGNYSPLSAPAIANGVVYISSADLVALDARTGKLLWSLPIGNSYDIFSSPSVSNGVVYVGSQDGAIYAVEVGGTSLLWSYATGGPIYRNLAVGNGVVYLSSSDGNLYAFDAYSGIVLWKYPYLSSSPALANGVVYVGVQVSHTQSNVSALDARSGSLLWQYEISPSGLGDPSVADGMVYVGDFFSNVYAFGLTHGESQGVLSARPDPGTLIPDLGLRNFP